MLNPVLRKDVVSLLRLGRVAIIQVVVALVLGILVLASWPQAGVLRGTIAVAETAANKLDDQLLIGLVMAQMVLLCLFVPGVAGASLTSEREQNTLEMLYASRLSPAAIILGKVLATLAFPLLLLLTGLPFMAMISYRGDVSSADFIGSVALLALAGVYLAMICLAISAFCKTSSNSLVLCYSVTLILGGVVLVPAAIMGSGVDSTWGSILHYIRGLSPVAAGISMLRSDWLETSGLGLLPLWEAFCLIAPVVIGVCALAVVVKLARTPGGEHLGVGGTKEQQNSTLRRILYLIDPKKQRSPIRWGNPVLVKESRTNPLRSGSWIIRMLYGATALSLGIATMALYSGAHHADLTRYVATILVSSQLGLIALLVPSMSSSTISSELENGTWETLRLAPIGGGKIFWGKLLPAVPICVLPIIALLPAYGTLAYIQPSYIPNLLRMLPVMVLSSVLSLIIGIACSSFFSTSAKATVAAYAVSAGLLILPMLAWYASPTPLPLESGKWIAFLSPLSIALNLLPSPAAPLLEGMYTYHLYALGGLALLLLITARLRLSVLLRRGA